MPQTKKKGLFEAVEERKFLELLQSRYPLLWMKLRYNALLREWQKWSQIETERLQPHKRLKATNELGKLLSQLNQAVEKLEGAGIKVSPTELLSGFLPSWEEQRIIANLRKEVAL